MEHHEYTKKIQLQIQEEELKQKDRCAIEQGKLTQLEQENKIFKNQAGKKFNQDANLVSHGFNVLVAQN